MKTEIGKRYGHYKNGKTYRVVGIALHTETEEQLVSYEGEYSDPKLGDRPLFARPLAMFEEKVRIEDGTEVDRFRRIGEA